MTAEVKGNKKIKKMGIPYIVDYALHDYLVIEEIDARIQEMRSFPSVVGAQFSRDNLPIFNPSPQLYKKKTKTTSSRNPARKGE